MSELISGIDVPRLVKDGVDVQYRPVTFNSSIENKWIDFSLEEHEEEFTLGDFINHGRWDFRLKPHTITINGIEVPAPFEPKIDDGFWHISTENDGGYAWQHFENRSVDYQYIQFGTWRTEDEIEQVVSALRSIFKGEM